MNNIIISVKRFLQNKNTVTILGVLGVILILFFGYRFQINKMVSPVSGIPVAAQTIQPRTKITSDMIKYIDVAPIVLQDNVIRSSGAIINKYSAVNTVIPEGSMFYQGVVVNELANNAVKVGEGLVPYIMSVNMETSYAKSIYPEDYVDLYMKAVNEEGTLMVGRLVENIKITAVRDSSGNDVYENTTESRTPAYLIFGLNQELNILVKKASYMGEFSTEVFPVPHGTVVEPAKGETKVSSQTLKDFINANSVPNDEIESSNKTEEKVKS